MVKRKAKEDMGEKGMELENEKDGASERVVEGKKGKTIKLLFTKGNLCKVSVLRRAFRGLMS